jgi:hypothetical protein
MDKIAAPSAKSAAKSSSASAASSVSKRRREKSAPDSDIELVEVVEDSSEKQSRKLQPRKSSDSDCWIVKRPATDFNFASLKNCFDEADEVSASSSSATALAICDWQQELALPVGTVDDTAAQIVEAEFGDAAVPGSASSAQSAALLDVPSAPGFSCPKLADAHSALVPRTLDRPQGALGSIRVVAETAPAGPCHASKMSIAATYPDMPAAGNMSLAAMYGATPAPNAVVAPTPAEYKTYNAERKAMKGKFSKKQAAKEREKAKKLKAKEREKAKKLKAKEKAKAKTSKGCGKAKATAKATAKASNFVERSLDDPLSLYLKWDGKDPLKKTMIERVRSKGWHATYDRCQENGDTREVCLQQAREGGRALIERFLRYFPNA